MTWNDSLERAPEGRVRKEAEIVRMHNFAGLTSNQEVFCSRWVKNSQSAGFHGDAHSTHHEE
jgi:hypothetical protein